MKPRFAADYRMLLWMIVLVPAVPIAILIEPALGPWLLPIALYLSYCTGIASHCHNHCPVFTSRHANRAYSAWLSVFYGYPVFAWIPTHNQNHHKYGNGPGDVTRTTRYAPRNTFWRALTYPIASAIYQAPCTTAYVRSAFRDRSARRVDISLQYTAVVVCHGAFLVAAVQAYGLTKGCIAYGFAMGVPAAFATWSMMFTNYVQHVGCEPGSANNHSRNFVSGWLNWWVFDAGYHTVHHENPGTHWSQYRQLHRSRVNAIAPELNQSSVFWYCWTTYALSPMERRPG